MLLCLLRLLLVGVCSAEQSEALSGVPVVNGLVRQLAAVFSGQPLLSIEKAVADGLMHALDDESMDIAEVACNRDYSRLCPEGWIDAGDGNSCLAPKTYQGKCDTKMNLGGLTPLQKRQQTSKCDVLYPCVGACSPDYSKRCPLGWLGDFNNDCLAPAQYVGPCVARKSFQDMKVTEKAAWAKRCDVTWPCRETLGDVMEVQKIHVNGIFNDDCVMDYSQPCPARFAKEDKLCQAPPDFSGVCGLYVPASYTPQERAAYSKACLTPWPCQGDASVLK